MYYAGAYLDNDAQATFTDHVLSAAKIEPPFEAPTGVEICPRTSADGKPIYIIINHERGYRTVPLPWPAWEHLSGRPVGGVLEMDSYGVAVITKV